MTHDVFVSYSNKDKAVADSIVATLERNNIRCWYAPRDIKPGQDWGQAIASAIAESRVFLTIFSGNANRSQRVLDEVNLAIDGQAALIPFRIENLKPKGAMKLHLSSRHWLDAFEPTWQSHIVQLVREVSTNLGMELNEKDIVVPANVLMTHEKPKSKKRIPAGIIIAAVLIIAVGLSYLLWKNFGSTLLAQNSEIDTPTQTEQTTLLAQVDEEEPTLTLNPTSTITQTPIPSITSTMTQTKVPDWVTIVSEPVLTAIENNPPTFEDDFSRLGSSWNYEYLLLSNEPCTGAFVGVSNDVLMANLVPDCSFILMENYEIGYVEDFVLQVEINFKGDSDLRVEFTRKFFDQTGLTFVIKPNGQIHFLYSDTNGSVIDANNRNTTFDNSEPVQVTLIFSTPVFLAYIDSELIIARNDLETYSGLATLEIDIKSSNSSESETVELDNLKVWELNEINMPSGN